jgi:hypothetical protein
MAILTKTKGINMDSQFRMKQNNKFINEGEKV